MPVSGGFETNKAIAQKQATALVKRLAALYAPPSCEFKLSPWIIPDLPPVQDQFIAVQSPQHLAVRNEKIRAWRSGGGIWSPGALLE